MKLLPNTINYQEAFSTWAGCKAGQYDDFDVFCDSDFDFIEILMLFEKEFSVNLLETSKVRQDFTKVHEFISWAGAQPPLVEASAFSISCKATPLLSCNSSLMTEIRRFKAVI